MVALNPVGQFQTVHAGQHDVGDHDLQGVDGKQIQGLFSTGGHRGLVPGGLDELVHGIPNGKIIVNNKYVWCHGIRFHE
jgi:hypothetical protein